MGHIISLIGKKFKRYAAVEEVNLFEDELLTNITLWFLFPEY